MSDISTAINLRGDSSSGVDPRTGQYYFSFPIINIKPIEEFQPSIEINLNFNQGSMDNEGFGQGWRISIASYNANNETIKLKTGAEYKIARSGERLFLVNYKSKDIKLSEDASNIYINYKDGNVDKLSKTTGRLSKSNGVDFEWDENGRIKKIINGERHVITFNMSSGQVAIEIKSFGVGISAVYVDLIYGERLSKIRYGYGLEKHFLFQYRDISNSPHNILVISKVSNNFGRNEIIEYIDHGLSRPNNFPYKENMPCVSTYTVKGDVEPERTAKYEFSSRNYFGFDSGISWENGVDILDLVTKEYQYYTIETLPNKKIKRIYSKFHLLIQETCFDINNRKHLDTLFKYFANLDAGIKEQPYNYTLISDASYIYYDASGASKKYIESFAYDDYSNLTSHTNKHGEIKKYSYYKENGEIDLCPPNRLGMIAYIKSMTTYPRGNLSQGLSVIYTYEYLGTSYTVVRKKEFREGLEIEYAYYTDEPFFGLIKRINILGVKPEGTSTTTYNYSRNENILKVTQEFSSNEISNVVISSVDESTDRVISEINTDGVETAYIFNNDGIIEKIIHAKGTHYEMTNNYSIYYQAGEGVVLSEIDYRGCTTNQYLTSSLLPYKITRSIGDSHQTIKTLTYNSAWHVIKEVECDSVNGKDINLTKEFKYDIYGNVSFVKSSNGDVQNILINYTDNTKTTATHELNSIIIEIFDDFNMLSKKLYFVKTIKVKEENFTYDGYGNKIKEESSLGLTINSEYDELGRLTKSNYTFDDYNYDVFFDYASFGAPSKNTSVTVDGIELGGILYDASGRAIQESSGGRVVKYTYNTTSMPIEQSLNDGKYCKFTNIPEIKKISSTSYSDNKSLNCSYNYSYSSSDLTSAKNSNCTMSFQRDKLGRITNETVSVTNVDTRSREINYSIGGCILNEVDFFGTRKIYTYNDNGYLSRININDGIELNEDVNFEHDEKLNVVKVWSDEYSIAIEYDTLRRELSRTFVIASKKYVLNLTYNDALNKLKTKRFSYGDFFVEDEYSYDAKGRIKEVSFNSNDSNMSEIKKIIYKYTSFDGIQTKEYYYSNGNFNLQTYHYNGSRLIRISNTLKSMPSFVDLEYDDSGNLIKDENGNKYTFNQNGQVESFISSHNEEKIDYLYNPLGEIITTKGKDFNFTKFYSDGNIVNEKSVTSVTVVERCVKALDFMSIRSFSGFGTLTKKHYVMYDCFGSNILEYARSGSRGVELICHYQPFGTETKHLLQG